MERQGQIPQIKRTSSLFATLDVAWSSENEPDDHILSPDELAVDLIGSDALKEEPPETPEPRILSLLRCDRRILSQFLALK
ncbi:hypothetical protein GX50_00709 [[Emmonsia] crescens]|uniref:Uncharacterized protein n=1 Tax=[Emmonsia] crescens TaxID=73230 RepID=A0A2B7ZIS5_9EURO|nr:hypothetical protein GX50_00709 [Emmonsia crescens]